MKYKTTLVFIYIFYLAFLCMKSEMLFTKRFKNSLLNISTFSFLQISTKNSLDSNCIG